MSATYAHYSAAPSSLPSDYGLLSRYANARTPQADDDDDDSDELNDNDPELLAVRAAVRRPSIPSSVRRSAVPTMASSPSQPHTSETTPLLGTQLSVPRIVEETEGPSDGDEKPISWATYWEESKILMGYTIPVFGTHLLEYSLVIASVISIGHLSTVALAASTLGSMTASVTAYSILQGFASTLDTVLPSAWTSEQPHLVGLWAQRMAIVMAATLIPISCIWASAESILLILRQDPEVAHLAALYLRWSLLGLPAYAFNQIARRYFQAQGLFAVPTHVILAVAPVNAILNYILVWGPEPVRLGFIGAPIASAVSFNLIALLSIAYGIFWVPKTAWSPISRRAFSGLGILVQLGLAGVGQSASEWWSWELIGLAASQLGPVALATQSVLLVSGSTSYQAPFSLSVAASVRIGNLLGEKNANRASIAAKVSFMVVLIISGINSSIFLIFRKTWGHLFNDDPEVVALVSSILPIVALFQVVDGLSACTSGVLRARGKQAAGALLNLSAYYMLGIPFGLWLTFSRGMELMGLWVGLTVALVYCSTVGLWMCLRTDWDREVEKVQRRVEKERKEDEQFRALTSGNA